MLPGYSKSPSDGERQVGKMANPRFGAVIAGPRSEVLFLFVAVFSFFSLFCSGRINVDSFYSYLTARSLIQTGSPALTEEVRQGLDDPDMPHSSEFWNMGTNPGIW